MRALGKPRNILNFKFLGSTSAILHKRKKIHFFFRCVSEEMKNLRIGEIILSLCLISVVTEMLETRITYKGKQINPRLNRKIKGIFWVI